MKGIPEARILPYIPEWTKQNIEPYTTPLLRVRKDKTPEEVVLIGSGTLIKTQKAYGILTAQHVVEALKNATELGLALSSYEQRYSIDINVIKTIDVAKPTDSSILSGGPDLAIIILPHSIGTLKAIKSFYDISYKREERSRNPLDDDIGIWILCGFIGEQTKHVPSKLGYKYALELRGLHGLTRIRKKYIRGNYDFAEVGVDYNLDNTLPISWGGISGGGLWQMLLKELENGVIEVEKSILSGVAFYQTEIESNKRHIICQGPRSIYEMVYNSMVQFRGHLP